MLIAIWPIVVLLAGILLWVLPANTTLKRMGEISFFCGLLVLVMVLARQTLKIG